MLVRGVAVRIGQHLPHNPTATPYRQSSSDTIHGLNVVPTEATTLLPTAGSTIDVTPLQNFI